MPDESAAQPDAELLGQAFFREGGAADTGTGRGTLALRRFGVRFAIVLALLALLDLWVRAACPPELLLDWTLAEEAAYTVKVQRFREASAPDVLFLGSSRVRDGLVPEVFAADLSSAWGRPASVYNLGLMAAKAEEYLALARSHLPDPPPRRVVLGLTGSEVVRAYNFQYASRFLWRLPDALDWLGRTPADVRDPEHVGWYLESLLGRLWYAFGQRDALRGALLDRLRAAGLAPALEPAQVVIRAQTARLSREFVLSQDGYRPRAEPATETLDVRIRNAPESIHVPPRELERSPQLMAQADFPELRALAALLHERGSRLALVETPVSPYLQRRNPVLHGPVFRERMSELAAELDILWVPMPPEETFLSDASYEDVNHLTEPGARRYTRLVYRGLAQRGFFEDRAP